MLAVVGVPGDGEPFLMPLSTELTDHRCPARARPRRRASPRCPATRCGSRCRTCAASGSTHFAVLTAARPRGRGRRGGRPRREPPGVLPDHDRRARPGRAHDDAARRPRRSSRARPTTPGCGGRSCCGACSPTRRALVTSDLGRDRRRRGRERDHGRRRAARRCSTMPTERVTATIVLPELSRRSTDCSPERSARPMPVSTIVQNGSGEPGVGEAVAARIIPAGFRVVLSQNAQTFDVDSTDVFANGTDHEDEARAVKEALGVGPCSRGGGTIERRRHHDRGGEGLHGLTQRTGQRGQAARGALPPSRDVAIAAARAAADKQASDIVVLDVHEIIVITDHFVICSAGTQRQIRTVIDAVEAVPARAGREAHAPRGRARGRLVAARLLRRRGARVRRGGARLLRPGASVVRRPAGRVADFGRGLIGPIESSRTGPIAQLVERLAGSQEVRGSTPLGSTESPKPPGQRPNRRNSRGSGQTMDGLSAGSGVT